MSLQHAYAVANLLDGLAVGADRDAIERRGIVEAPGEPVRGDDLHADRLVLRA